MRSEVIDIANLKITLYDKSETQDWGFDKSVAMIIDSVVEMERFLYSKHTLISRDLHPSVELDVTFCDADEIQSLNREHRQKDKPTDVLSFPVFDSLRSDSEESVFPGPVSIGDVIICTDVALKQAKEFEIEIEQEIIHLLVHGFLHLLGWDHEISEKEEKLMEIFEQSLLTKIKIMRDI